MPSVTPYGEKLQSLRKALGLTQLELALRAGVSERTIRNAECSRPLKREFLDFLATALGVELQDIARKPAELASNIDWQRNLSIADELLKRFTLDFDTTGLLDLVDPRLKTKYDVGCLNMGGLADRYMQCRTGVDEAKRVIDWMGEFNSRIVERRPTFQPPAGDGRLVVLRATDHLTYTNGIQENAWSLHVVEFEHHRVRRWENYGGPLTTPQN